MSEEQIRNIENHAKGAIDYVFVTADTIQITDHVVRWKPLYGDYPSDHPAVYSTIEFLNVNGEIDHGWNG